MERRAPLGRRADEAQCASQALYSNPAAGQEVDSSVDTTIEWDQSCLETGVDKIDIYLYAPTSAKANLPIHAWTGVPATKGSYQVKLAPSWWNVTTDQTSHTPLSLNIVKAGNEPWDSANPFGPTFSALYTAPAAGSSPPEDAVQGSSTSTKLISAFYEGGSLTAGGKAAAIICPIIVVAVALGIFIRKLHINRNNKTADWADHMDKRMSRISMDWVSGGDGSAGPVPGSRPASYYQGNRPSGTFARPSAAFARANGDRRSVASGNLAGRGVDAAKAIHGIDDMEPDFADEHEMHERRPRGESMYNDSNRQSRISFANETQGDRVSRISFGAPSSNDHSMGRAGRGRRENGDAPAVPAVDPSYRMRDSAAYADATQEEMEDDMDGARALGARDVDARMSESNWKDSIADYPAVHMLDADGEGKENVAQGHAGTPDDAMRQYAAGRSGSSMGQHARTGSSTAMRTLYTPQPGLGHRTQGSLHTTGSSVNEDEVVGYREANML
ncbi:unnamed protein product [Jaminaea pallidilutea]